MRAAWAIAIAAAIGAPWTGCSRCGEEPRPATGAAAYDVIALGADEATLRGQLADLGGFDREAAARFVECRALPRLDVLDVEDESLVERPVGDHQLVRCTLLGGRFERAATISSAHADLLDGRVVAAQLSFYIGEYAPRRAELEAYLGPGAEVRLEERSLLGEAQRDAVVWRKGGVAWAIYQGREARILKQDAAALAGLPDPDAPGAGTSLEALGLGGGLDLDKPLPNDEGLVPVDAGAR